MSKVILEIGGHRWIAPDMAKAGKLADMLNSFVPANRDYRNSKREVYVTLKGRDHTISINELPEAAVLVKSLDEAVKLRDKADDKRKDLL